MDVRSLQYALTLADELHFGRAARAHYISAQPFGRRIEELERELGTRLFDRTSRRVTLTPAGERFLPRARRVLNELDALTHVAAAEHSEQVLRVGVLGFGLADLWPSTRALLARYEPGLRVSYVELDWGNQYDAVRAGEVDIAVLQDLGGADDLHLETVVASERFAVVPAESELADAPHLTVGDLSERPCVVPIGQPGLSDWTVGRVSRGAAEVRSPSNIPAAVAMTGLFGVQVEQARRFLTHPGVRYVPLDGPRAVVALATRSGDLREPVSAFRNAVQMSMALSHISAV